MLRSCDCDGPRRVWRSSAEPGIRLWLSDSFATHDGGDEAIRAGDAWRPCTAHPSSQISQVPSARIRAPALGSVSRTVCRRPESVDGARPSRGACPRCRGDARPRCGRWRSEPGSGPGKGRACRHAQLSRATQGSDLHRATYARRRPRRTGSGGIMQSAHAWTTRPPARDAAQSRGRSVASRTGASTRQASQRTRCRKPSGAPVLAPEGCCVHRRAIRPRRGPPPHPRRSSPVRRRPPR